MFSAVDRETRVRDAVRIPPDDRAEIRRRGKVRLEAVESKDDIGGDAVRVGHGKRRDDAPVGQDIHLETASVA